MIIIKLLALVALVEVVAGAAPSPSPAELSNDEIVQRPKDIHKAFIELNHVAPSAHYRYGSQIFDPLAGVTTSHYELHYHDVTVGSFNRAGVAGDRLSTVNYTIDATDGYRATFTEDSPERKALDYAHITSPLASATPPNEQTEAFTSFLVGDGENIEMHSPEARSAFKTHVLVKGYYVFVPTITYTWGYEIDSMASQYETYVGDRGEGRVTLVDADGCVSSIDYRVDADHFNVSTVRVFGKEDVKRLYLNPQHYPLLLKIASGSSKCGV